MNVQTRERVLTELDHLRLATLSSQVARARLPNSPGIDALLDDARVVPSRRVASDIVTMYSQVRLRFVDDGMERKLTLCYPAERRTSVRIRVCPVADRPESAGSAGRRDRAMGVSGRERANGRSRRDSVSARSQRRLHNVVGCRSRQQHMRRTQVLRPQEQEMTLDRILVAVSFSERSIDAVRKAARLAADRHSNITLLHVVEPAKRSQRPAVCPPSKPCFGRGWPTPERSWPGMPARSLRGIDCRSTSASRPEKRCLRFCAPARTPMSCLSAERPCAGWRRRSTWRPRNASSASAPFRFLW